MALLSLQGVSLNLGGKTLLREADLQIEPGERVCLIGRNGAGKSSLMALLSGELTPDGGSIVRTPGIAFGHMPQAVPEHWSGPVFGVVAAGMGVVGEALGAAHLIATGREELLSPERHEQARILLETGDGWERHGDVLGVINQLGLDPETDFVTLSGGNRRRVALARALVAAENLLLDEPTNHLDIKTIAWLEDFLARRGRTLVFISHDRAFVRRLATRIVEVDREQLFSYACTYDQFLERREARLDAEEKQAASFDKKLAQEEAWIRQGVKARRTRNMGRVRALQSMRKERMGRNERLGTVSMRAQEAERSGKLVIETRAASFTYPDGYAVFRDCSTIIQRGDRVGLVGNNGTGKTTLLRLLLGELEPTSGTVRHGTRLEISYFDQLRSTLDPDASVMDSVAEGNDVVIINGQQRHVAGYLLDFLFESDRLRIPVRALSGGERNRLLLAKLFTKPSNVLVLDEPTNDLDVETLELLEELLDAYTGTVLLVSHDRAFLDNLVTTTLALEGDGLVHEYVGGYTDWIRQRPTGACPATTSGPSTATKAATIDAGSTTGKELRTEGKLTQRKLTFKEQRERDLLQKELAALPDTLAALEAEQHKLEADLAEPDFFARDPKAFNAAANRITQLDAEQTLALQRWETIELRLSEL
ncbi:MAG: ATP-binding cassette domain-containing protein [Bilophila sp.]